MIRLIRLNKTIFDPFNSVCRGDRQMSLLKNRIIELNIFLANILNKLKYPEQEYPYKLLGS